LPDDNFEKYMRYVGMGCAGGSGGLAGALAKQMNEKRKAEAEA